MTGALQTRCRCNLAQTVLTSNFQLIHSLLQLRKLVLSLHVVADCLVNLIVMVMITAFFTVNRFVVSRDIRVPMDSSIGKWVYVIIKSIIACSLMSIILI